MKHKHHDLIVEWVADTTRKVECRLSNGEWQTTETTVYRAWDESLEYRFADSVLRYRVALFENRNARWTSSTDDLARATNWEGTSNFVGWITDWVEVDEPVAEKPEPKTKKFERWLNLYRDGTLVIHHTKESADEEADANRVECRHIEWEVPE